MFARIVNRRQPSAGIGSQAKRLKASLGMKDQKEG
jgi:hypothetical protein